MPNSTVHYKWMDTNKKKVINNKWLCCHKVFQDSGLPEDHHWSLAGPPLVYILSKWLIVADTVNMKQHSALHTSEKLHCKNCYSSGM